MYFRTGKKKFKEARRLVTDAEALRAHDSRFADLKIGVAEGELIGEFDWLGRVKKDGVGLLGETIVEAVRGEKIPGDYKVKLNSIAESLHGQKA